jgi:hypothetical protein
LAGVAYAFCTKVSRGLADNGQAGRYMSQPHKVIAVQMKEPFEVVLPDGVSRLHGHPEDWLIDYGDGSLGVISPGIFAATYRIEG